ncbi:hypothetical protein [Limnothrix redekei]|uniref:Uncharacterized protein n=1 Tax=Limnothrix redekei LRLZ20PSL1 TaxID=3112953 RepID=A0ABW7C5B2_9CYAN
MALWARGLAVWGGHWGDRQAKPTLPTRGIGRSGKGDPRPKKANT